MFLSRWLLRLVRLMNVSSKVLLLVLYSVKWILSCFKIQPVNVALPQRPAGWWGSEPGARSKAVAWLWAGGRCVSGWASGSWGLRSKNANFTNETFSIQTCKSGRATIKPQITKQTPKLLNLQGYLWSKLDQIRKSQALSCLVPCRSEPSLMLVCANAVNVNLHRCI